MGALGFFGMGQAIFRQARQVLSLGVLKKDNNYELFVELCNRQSYRRQTNF